MGRAPCCDKDGLKKGPWTPEEDQKLIDYIQKHGYGNWRTLPKNAGLQRCGKSCRLRWTNYLRPDIKRGRFSFEEEEIIIQLHSILGNKWSAIAARLPGRTDNEIKNYWNTHIRKRLLRMGIDPVTHSPRLDLLDFSSILNSSLYNNSSQMNLSRLLGLQPLVNPELLTLANTLLSTHQRQNPSFLVHNLQENQLSSDAQIQNTPTQVLQSTQIQTPIQSVNPTACTTTTTTSSTRCLPFQAGDEAQVARPNFENYPSTINFDVQNFVDGSCSQLNECQSSAALSSDLIQDFANYQPSYYYGASQDQKYIMNPSSYDSTLQSNAGNQNFSFCTTTGTSVLSTPSSSPTPLNSSSTYFNSGSTTTTTEDERESYCSNMVKFEIPDILHVSELLQ